MRRYNTESEIKCIPNVSYKRNVICRNYMEHCNYTDIQGYFMEQLRLNVRLLAWLFSDNSLIGKSHLSLSPERYKAFEDFYDSLNVYE